MRTVVVDGQCSVGGLARGRDLQERPQQDTLAANVTVVGGHDVPHQRLHTRDVQAPGAESQN